ncbi:uncharacterized membrane protein HdeD (DUF308 family) [Deinococcus sp. UYEF24]
MRQGPLSRREQVRAWTLITLGALMSLAGIVMAIHKFTVLDLPPIAVGIATIAVGFRYLRRKEIV